MNRRFAGYVQSIAFNMTLSRNMIDALDLIRRQGCIHCIGGDAENPRLDSYSVSYARALERRGLVEHWNDVYPERSVRTGDFVYRLTRAGELVCELLEEAGLLARLVRNKRRRAA